MWSRALQVVGAETLARIRRDKERQPRNLQRLLSYIEKNLFRKELTVGKLARDCQLSGTTVHEIFRERLRCTPWSYIRDRRMEVAARLLSSGIRIWQIVDAVGYCTTINFKKIFSEWAGVSPEQYLQNVQNKQCSANSYGRDFWRKLNRGKTEREQAEWVVDQIEELYGLSPEVHRSEFSDTDFEEEVMAEVVWRRLCDKSFEEQKHLISKQYGFRKPVLFNLLLAKSQEMPRRDPRLAVQLAELALKSLDAAEWALIGDFPDLRARGSAWLGNARRRTLDFSGAEQAFEWAEQAWNSPRPERDIVVLGEIFLVRAGLRADQRRFEEARCLVNDGIRIFRSEGRIKLLAQALIERATIVGYNGDPQDTLDDLEEALQVLEEHLPDSLYLHLSAICNLATSYALSRRFEDAERLLPIAQDMVKETTDTTTALHLRWTAGLVAQGQDNRHLAENCFLETMRGFTALGQSDHAAVAALELAVLYAEQGRTSAAIDLAAGAIPTFEAFKIQPEAMAALDLIREAVATSSLPVSIAKEIRGHLRALSRDPLFSVEPRQQAQPHG